jgi:putative ABC transport system permease protein
VNAPPPRLPRLRLIDGLTLGAIGLRARRIRSAMSALGVAIAVAALVSVLGITASSTSDLLAQLGEEGNLLTLAAGQTFDGDPTPLPLTAEAMVRRIPPVRSVASVGAVVGATVRRSPLIPNAQTSGISVLAAEPSLVSTMSIRMLTGRFLDAASGHYPMTVLGRSAAQNLGITRSSPTTLVYLDNHYFTVIGVLAPVATAPEIDNAALIGFPVAGDLFGLEHRPTRIYLRADPDQVAQVAAVLPFTASPFEPEAVSVRRPSDVLVARVEAKTASVLLFLGLAVVALLVGGVGIGNIMVISVLERRGEIGLRRALGARGRHIAGQFLLESALVSTLGGVAGIGLGCLVTVVVANSSGNTVAIPLTAVWAGLGAAIGIGILAGVYPAARAARIPPWEALRSL